MMSETSLLKIQSRRECLESSLKNPVLNLFGPCLVPLCLESSLGDISLDIIFSALLLNFLDPIKGSYIPSAL